MAALGPGLHRTAPGVTQQLVDCSGGDEVNEETGFARKAAALSALLQERRSSRTIVSLRWGLSTPVPGTGHVSGTTTTPTASQFYFRAMPSDFHALAHPRSLLTR